VFDIVSHVDQAGYTLKIRDIALSCGDIAGHRLERSLRSGVPRKQDLSIGRCGQRRVYLDLYLCHIGVVVIHRANTLHSQWLASKQTEVGGEQFALAPQVFRLPGAGQFLTLGFQLAPVSLKSRAYLASQHPATFLQLSPLLSTQVARIDHVRRRCEALDAELVGKMRQTSTRHGHGLRRIVPAFSVEGRFEHKAFGLSRQRCVYEDRKRLPYPR